MATLFVAACGIDLVGTGAGLDGGTSDAEAPDGKLADNEVADTSLADVVALDDAALDAGSDADAEAEAPDACSATCLAAADTTVHFGPILFGDTTVACPAGYAQTDYVENPTAKPGACACAACAISADCDNGNVMSMDGDNANSCNSGGLTEPASTSCNFIGPGQNFAKNYVTFTTPTARNATCTSAGQGDSTQLMKPLHRVCLPAASTCKGDLCSLDVDGGAFKACVGSSTTDPCPAALPVRHVLGLDGNITLTCAACGCNVTTATCGGTMTAYASGNCTGASTAIVAGTCTQVNKGNVNSLEWAGTVQQQPANCATTVPANAAMVTMPQSGIACCAQ